MGFTAKQVQALREAHGRELSYVEGWYAISEANRIFGFDGWNRETVESRCVLELDMTALSSHFVPTHRPQGPR